MNKVNRLWSALEDWISGGLIVIGLAQIFYGVIMRYVFNNPITWVEEISKYFIIWGSFIGAAVALRDDHHIKVDLLYRFFPKQVKKIVSIFANLVGVFFSCFLAYYGTDLLLSKWHIGQRSMDVGVPLWLIYIIFPISGVLLIIRFLEQLYMIWTGKQRQGGITY